jgi:hypothetical protein
MTRPAIRSAKFSALIEEVKFAETRRLMSGKMLLENHRSSLRSAGAGGRIAAPVCPPYFKIVRQRINLEDFNG